MQSGGTQTWFEAIDDCQFMGGFLVAVYMPDDLTAALAVTPDPDGKYGFAATTLRRKACLPGTAGNARPSTVHGSLSRCIQVMTAYRHHLAIAAV